MIIYCTGNENLSYSSWNQCNNNRSTLATSKNSLEKVFYFSFGKSSALWSKGKKLFTRFWKTTPYLYEYNFWGKHLCNCLSDAIIKFKVRIFLHKNVGFSKDKTSRHMHYTRFVVGTSICGPLFEDVFISNLINLNAHILEPFYLKTPIQ